MKNYPYCNEEIQDATKKCKHCDELLDNNERKISSFLLLGLCWATLLYLFLFVGPVIEILMWL
jgi:hypothetical protein